MAKASVLFSGDVSVLVTDPTQLGRLSRNGIPQDWANTEPFPGLVNTTTSYHYRTVSIFVPNWFPFLQISLDSENPNIFGSAYDTTYNPANLSANWLGDPGFSANAFGNPLFFNVFAQTASATPSGGIVIIVLNETTTTGGGRNSPVGLVVEAFSDTEFNETTPEPSTYVFFGTGILALLALYRRKGLVHQSQV
ncbi:MAG: PEP-CTERM sorting domain-containing protein [Candidatus Solibacter sp.]